jgi:hypothetical protein
MFHVNDIKEDFCDAALRLIEIARGLKPIFYTLSGVIDISH